MTLSSLDLPFEYLRTGLQRVPTVLVACPIDGQQRQAVIGTKVWRMLASRMGSAVSTSAALMIADHEPELAQLIRRSLAV